MTRDSFENLARYYDSLMEHVDYNRWYLITHALADLVEQPVFRHLDIGCGTGTLVKKLLRDGWRSHGIDLSKAMLRAGRRNGPAVPAAVADMRRMPFYESIDYATCLFDSLNFLLEPEDVTATFQDVARALKPNGVFYFDLITERMVVEHFEGEGWMEDNGAFHTTWESVYDRGSGVADTSIRINTGPAHIVTERVYPLEQVKNALQAGGLNLLAALDAETWKKPRGSTIRIDVIAVKGEPRDFKKAFEGVWERARNWLA